MKTKEQSFVFTKEQVQQYSQLLGDSNPVYKSEEAAQKFGFQTIPVPPVMPMIVYKSFNIPWTMQSPVIHRKQQCIMHQQMFINEAYAGFVALTDVRVRQANTFSRQALYLYDEAGILSFSGILHIVSGELL